MKRILLVITIILCSYASFAQSEEYANKQIQIADSLNLKGLSLIESGQLEYAIECFTKAFDISTEVYGENNIYSAGVLMNMAYSYKELGKYTESLTTYTKALKSLEIGSYDYFYTLENIFYLTQTMGEYQESLKCALTWLYIKDKKHENKDTQYANMLIQTSNIYSMYGLQNKANKYQEKALKLLKKLFPKNDEYIASLCEISIYFIENGNYNEALKYGLKALEICKKEYGDKTYEYIDVIEILAIAYTNIDDYKNSINYLYQSLEIEEKYYPNANRQTYIKILEIVGDLFYANDDYDNAIKYYELSANKNLTTNGMDMAFACTIDKIAKAYLNQHNYTQALKYKIILSETYEKIYDSNNILYASSLIQIAMCYSFIEEYGKSVEYALEGLEIFNKNFDDDDPKYTLILSPVLADIGSYYIGLGNYKEAMKYLLKASNITDKNTSDYASILSDIGIAYTLSGDFENGQKYIDNALAIEEKINGKSKVYIKILQKYANTFIDMSNYSTANTYLTQVLDLYKSPSSKNSFDYACVISDMGGLLAMNNDYGNSLKYYMQALDIYENVIGRDNSIYAKELGNIGVIYNNLGNHEKALMLQEQSLEILSKTVGEDNIEYASALINKGTALAGSKDWENAFKCFARAVEIQKNILGEKNPELVPVLHNIGYLLSLDGAYEKAIEYYNLTKDIIETNYGKKHISYAESLSGIASTLIRRVLLNDVDNNKAKEDINLALKYDKEALEIFGELLGEDSEDYASTLNTLGVAYNHINDYETSSKYYMRALEIQKNRLMKNFAFMTAKEREAYWNYSNESLFIIENAAKLTKNKEVAKASYNVELINKGLLLTSEVEFNRIIAESKDKKLIADLEMMKALNIMLNKELEKNISDRNFDCDSLENEIHKLEQHLIETSSQYGDFTKSIAIDWKDVQNSLKDNDVAIEFSNFTKNDTTRYIALVLTKKMDAPVCVPLFEQSELQELQRGISSAKTETPSNDDNRGAISVSAKRQGIYESTGLYNALWKPVEKYFPENPRIYFAPSGMLHQIAVEYAPINRDKTISDKYEVYRISSTRVLAQNYTTKPMKNSVLYGGILYDSDTITMKQESERYSTRSVSYTTFAEFNKDEERGSVNFLPGTKAEVDGIVNTLKKGKIATTLYEGSQANEESFKALSGKGISILHIATHGFFLPSDKKLEGDQSLIQSGLMLSGANYAWQNLPIPEGVEDGILTAKEISFMDLRKTDLVVLSACQTALGEITGEGVFGLQRGFKKAGVRTIIMSLWPVDDNATLLMMTEFYNNLTNGMTKREAFLAAQNKVKTTAGFENPRYWAAFIMLDGNN